METAPDLDDLETEILVLSSKNPLSNRLEEVRALAEDKQARRDPVIAYRYSYNDIIERYKGRGQRAVERLELKGLLEKQKWAVATGRRRSFLLTLCATPDGQQIAEQVRHRLSTELAATIEQTETEQAAAYLHETFGIDVEGGDFWIAAIQRAKALDENLLDSRSARRPHENYSLMVRGALQEARSSTLADYERLAHQMKVRNLAVQRAPLPDVAFEMSDDLRRLTIRVRDESPLVIAQPPLLWPCPCKASTTFPVEKRTCAIHESPQASAITAAFSEGWVEIVFRKTRILWRNDSGVWPPSIDSFHLVNTILRSGVVAGRDSGRIIDLGSGTGFIGLALRLANVGVSHVTYSDWLFNTFWSTRLNVARNGDEEAATVRIANGLHPEGLPLSRQSLIICNPPYLPVEQHPRLAVHHTVAGTALLEEVARDGGRVAKRALLGCSELALPELDRAAGEANTSIRQLGDWRTVPFRVAHFLDNRDYLEWLIKNRGLRYEPDGPFPLLHRLGVFELEYAP